MTCSTTLTNRPPHYSAEMKKWDVQESPDVMSSSLVCLRPEQKNTGLIPGAAYDGDNTSYCWQVLFDT